MAPLLMTMRDVPISRQSARREPAGYDLNNPAALSTHSHQPEAQEVIREGVRRGLIRVVPIPGNPTHVRLVRAVPAAPRVRDRLEF